MKNKENRGIGPLGKIGFGVGVYFVVETTRWCLEVMSHAEAEIYKKAMVALVILAFAGIGYILTDFSGGPRGGGHLR